jgi:hypothetical protein
MALCTVFFLVEWNSILALLGYRYQVGFVEGLKDFSWNGELARILEASRVCVRGVRGVKRTLLAREDEEYRTRQRQPAGAKLNTNEMIEAQERRNTWFEKIV